MIHLAGRSLRQLPGKTLAASRVARMPAKPIRVIIGVCVRSVSCFVIPLIRLITQKPLSFIHGNGVDPQPMAVAR